MYEGFPQKWYLQLDGKRMGPFAPEQVLGLLSEGEIPEGLLVSPAEGELAGLTQMTAAEMRDAYFREDRLPPVASTEPPTAPSHSTQDPPDAAEVDETDAAANLATSRRLFELFQSAKERRARFAPAGSQGLLQSQDDGTPVFRIFRSKALLSGLAAALIATIGVKLTVGRNSGEQPQREIAQSSPDSATTQGTEPSSRAAPSAAARTNPPPSTGGSTPTQKIQNNWKPAPRPAGLPSMKIVGGRLQGLSAPIPRREAAPLPTKNEPRPEERDPRDEPPPPPESQESQDQGGAQPPPAPDGAAAPETPPAPPPGEGDSASN